MNTLRRSSLIACSLILTALILLASFSALTPTKPPLADDQPQKAIISAYTAHAPIFILNNSGFLGPNASTGISWGSGTASDPYIIEGWDIIASSSNGIDIRNSTIHFIVRDCNIHGIDTQKGIVLSNCENGVLERNTCSNNHLGIYLHYSDGNTLSNNTCSSNNNFCICYKDGTGIYLDSSSNNTLSNNTCSNNDLGIRLEYSDGNTLSNNNCSSSNYYHGIFIYFSDGNTLSNNNCSSNIDLGIYLEYSDSNTLSNNNCSSNNDDGIYLESSNNNTLSYNTCSNNDYGIYLYQSSDNTISNNDCSGNAKDGIYLSESSDDNTLINNDLGESNLVIAIAAIAISIVLGVGYLYRMEMRRILSNPLTKVKSFLFRNSNKNLIRIVIFTGLALLIIAASILFIYIKYQLGEEAEFFFYYFETQAFALSLAISGIFLLSIGAFVGVKLRQGAHLRINLLCVLGAMIGLMAFYETWVGGGTHCMARGMDDSQRNLLELIFEFYSSSIPLIFFLIGTITALFISPAGGFLQAIGVVWFGGWFFMSYGSFSDNYFGVGLGFVLGVISASIVIASFFKPIGMGIEKKGLGIKGRMLTVKSVKKRRINNSD